MCTTNLLVNIDSFAWASLTIDRSNSLDDFILAFGESEQNGDNIHNHPEFFTLALTWGEFYRLIFWDENTRRAMAPWLSRDAQMYLLKVCQRMPSPRPSSTLDELETEFPGCNNGLIGVSFNPAANPVKHIFDKRSWTNFHSTYVSQNRNIKDSCPGYFIKFYIPRLTTEPAKINQLIKEGRVDSLFKRLDSPGLDSHGVAIHGQQTHIHFNDKSASALNIDGTWKHKRCELPVPVRQQLEEWGFALPEV